MKARVAAIRLKIPDNEAYTALTALRRLGVEVGRLERAEVWILNDSGNADDFGQRVERNESLFNPNKHELDVLTEEHPRDGEVWISEIDAHEHQVRVQQVNGGRRYVAWRLFAHGHVPAAEAAVRDAVEKLLCNPAIEKALY
ncbi:MAG TPA: hypothetical protein VGZ02_09780 [Candidatus Baltobacteraceae bacterium]|nr:hypothetical protein [Candidatus Baltobacteraceae bacterium]